LRGRASLLLALVAAVVMTALLAGGAAAHPAQHVTPPEDHLVGTGAWGDIELVGIERVASTRGLSTQDLIADVAVDPRTTYAYLANWGEANCGVNSEAGGQNAPDAGAWVIDISNPADPKTVNFIPHSQDNAPGEGMQAFRLTTKNFNGYALLMNNEQCGKNGKGGITLVDVTNPLKPYKLSDHFGDRGAADVNDIHSAFAWDAGAKAYAVMVDNFEATDVDILDISNPKRPRIIADLNLNTMARALGDPIDQPEIGLQESSLHDMTVKQVPRSAVGLSGTGNVWVMLLSYWDGGYVLLNVNNPAAPTFIDDTDFTNPDPELLESAGLVEWPEGNGHQAEFTSDNEFFIATDEDFSPYRANFEITSGPNAGQYPAGEFGWTPSISTLPDGKLNGPTAFGGYGCPQSDASDIPSPSVVGTLAPGEEAILVLERGPVGDPAENYEACFFSEKVEAAQVAGWDAVVIANHHVGAQNGDAPDAQICGSQGHVFTPEIPGVCVGHRAMHLLFGTAPAYDAAYAGSEPAPGAVGEDISVVPEFDGWGYVHLYDSATRAELDTYAIDEAHDPAFASGYGTLSVHEVATDPQSAREAYLAYYEGGIRSLEIEGNELVETGGYIDPLGNDFWGVEAFVKNGTTYILGSDRDSGLWIFKNTG
jgi:hypothetical protein